jgi:hypothetical protein
MAQQNIGTELYPLLNFCLLVFDFLFPSMDLPLWLQYNKGPVPENHNHLKITTEE